MEKIQNAVANRQTGAVSQQKTINQLMASILDGEGMRKRFDELLGKRSATFISSLVTLVNAEPSLQQAMVESPMTVVQSALKAASFDLPIDNNLGYAYIVSFRNKKKNPDGTWTQKQEAQFMLGWKGMHQLANRTGAYKTINVIDIREGELKHYNRLTEEIEIEFIEDEARRESLPIVGFVGYYKLVNGAEKTIYRSKQWIEAHERKYRKGDYMSKGWRDDWNAMAMKTVYRELIGKWGVMSIEYQTTKDGQNLADQMKAENEMEDAVTAEFIEKEPDAVDTTTGEVKEAQA